MREVAFDESGNTGQYLLDRAQPVYALASVAKPAPEAAAGMSPLLENSPFSEFKFSTLRGSARGREILSSVFESDLLEPESARVVPVDKDWMVAGKMVDLLWEPAAMDSNAFYGSGMHRQIATMLQKQGPREAGQENWERWQRAFVAVVRNPEESEPMAEFAAALTALKEASQETAIGHMLDVVPDDADLLAALIPHGRDELDPALGGLVEQLHHWSERLCEPFRVVHDDSAVVRRWRDLLERMSDQEVPRSSFEVGDIRFVFPLMAPEIITADSRHSSAVQLADILSGAVMWCVRERVRGEKVPEEWWRWGLSRFIDFAQGAPDFLLGLVEPGEIDEPAVDPCQSQQ